jgi:hypothetical protein
MVEASCQIAASLCGSYLSKVTVSPSRIYSASPPEVRSALWEAHLERYKASHLDLSGRQRGVIEQAMTVVRDTSMFEQGIRSSEKIGQTVTALKNATVEAFGRDEAHALIAQLGPPAQPGESRLQSDCPCAVQDSWCVSPEVCAECCCEQSTGCGCGLGCCCFLRPTGCGSL